MWVIRPSFAKATPGLVMHFVRRSFRGCVKTRRDRLRSQRCIVIDSLVVTKIRVALISRSKIAKSTNALEFSRSLLSIGGTCAVSCASGYLGYGDNESSPRGSAYTSERCRCFQIPGLGASSVDPTRLLLLQLLDRDVYSMSVTDHTVEPHFSQVSVSSSNTEPCSGSHV
jgi:hypothetical protein